MFSAARTVAIGGLLGLTWGVLARVWMRFISDEPGFTWGGTAYILTSPTIIGLLAGLACVARHRGWRREGPVRIAGGASMILLGVAGGIIMLPSLLFGTFAAARVDLPRWVRAMMALLALVPAVAVVGSIGGGWLHVAIALAWYLLLLAGMITLLSVSVAPGTPAARHPADVGEPVGPANG